MFEPNTAFNNDVAYIYIPTDANYNDVRLQLDPILKDINSFDALAKQKKYTSNKITANVGKGKYEKTFPRLHTCVFCSINKNEGAYIFNTIFSGGISIKQLLILATQCIFCSDFF